MNLLDGLIIVVALGFAVSGYRRGLSWVSFSVAGLVVGLLIGALLAPWLAGKFIQGNPKSKATLAAAILLSTVLILQGVGTAIGYRVRKATLEKMDPSVATFDSILGSVLAIGALLASTWFTALTFRDTPYTAVSTQIQNSQIIRKIAGIAPPLPRALAQVGNVLHGASIPNPFSGLAPVLAPIAVPPSADTPGIRRAAKYTSKVLADSCGIEAGSSWPLGNDYMITNAHVVAGARRVKVEPPDGRSLAATVVLFDPETDVAILKVPGIGFPALARAGDIPQRGQLGAVIGFPEGGPEVIAPAAIKGVEPVDTQDIYGDKHITRQIEILAASVIPGDSGGLVVDLDGTVIGLTFATSQVDPGKEGYAVSIPQINEDIVTGLTLTASVSTQGCASSG